MIIRLLTLSFSLIIVKNIYLFFIDSFQIQDNIFTNIEIINLTNIQSCSLSNISLLNNTFFQSTWMNISNSNISFNMINVFDNIMQENQNNDFLLMTMTSNMSFVMMNFSNNIIDSYSFLLLENSNNLIMNSLTLNQNFITEFNEAKTSLIIINGVDKCDLEDFQFNNNSVNLNIIEIYSANHLSFKNISAIENLCQNLLWIENSKEIDLEYFICLKNNNNYNYFASQTQLFGSCLRVLNFINITINTSKVTDCLGFVNLPGFYLENTLSNSNISIINSIFSNNTFNSSSPVTSWGCSLYILNYPYLLIQSSYFALNAVLLINEIYGGPVLFYLANSPSVVILSDSVIENNLSFKKGLVLEFQGYQITFSNCAFLSNTQYYYTFDDFYTEMIINGIANDVEILNSSIINNQASDGFFFLYERNYLNMNFDSVKALYNIGYISPGFSSQFETTNRMIIFQNSVFSNNTVTYGGIFTYFYITSIIVKFSFLVNNSTIANNYANPTFGAFAVIWYYSNYFTFDIINSNLSGNAFVSDPPRAFFSIFGIQIKLPINFVNTSILNSIANYIFLLCFQCTLTFENLIFDGNVNNGPESFFDIQQTDFLINNVSFINNSADNIFFQFHETSNIFINNVYFGMNSFDQYFIFASDDPMISMDNFTMEKNFMQINGDIFISIQNVDQINLINISLLENSGMFSIVFWIYFCEVSLNNSEIISMDHERTIFQIIDCGFQILNLSCEVLKQYFIYSENSQISIENIIFDIILNNSNDFIWALTSEIELTQSSLSNFLFDELSYFLNAIQSQITFQQINIEKCGNLLSLKSSEIEITNSSFSNFYSSNEIIYLEKCTVILFDSTIITNFYSEKSAISIIFKSNEHSKKLHIYQ